MRKILSLVGAAGGLGYTAWGMTALYSHQAGPLPEGRIAIEALVFVVFTVPLGAAIGLGFGFLIEGVGAGFRSLLRK